MDVTDRDLTAAERTELDQDMATVEQLPHQAHLNIVRHMLRTGLYFRRTNNTEAAVSALRSIFTVIRHREDERFQKHLREACEARAAGDRTAVDPEIVLRRLRDARP